MRKKINLDEFWKTRFAHGRLPWYAKEMMIEYSNELLKLAAENARLKYTGDLPSGEPNYIVNKQSILDTINQIE